MNSELPKRTDSARNKTASFEVVTVFPGCIRAADGKSISTIITYLEARNIAQGTSLTEYIDKIYNPSYGDTAIQTEVGTGNSSGILSLHQPAPEVGIAVGARSKKVDALLNKSVTSFDYDGPMNKVGKYISQAEDAKQRIVNLSRSALYQKFVKFLKSKGLDAPAEIEEIVVGFMPQNQLEGVSADRKVVGISKNYHGFLEALAKEYGVSAEKLNEYVIALHMTTHRAGVDGGPINERKLEALVAEFLEKSGEKELAAKVPGRRYKDAWKNYGGLKGLIKTYFEAALKEGQTQEEAWESALETATREIKGKESKKEEKGKQKGDKKYQSKEGDKTKEEGNESESDESTEGDSDSEESSEGSSEESSSSE